MGIGTRRERRGKRMIVEITCGWCKKKFYRDTSTNKDGKYPILTCPHCARILPASKKVSTGNIVGRKHIHLDYMEGDIA